MTRYRTVPNRTVGALIATDQALRNREPLDFKSLDTALLGNDPLFEQDRRQIAREPFPWLDRADRRPVTKSEVAFGFADRQVYAVKGEALPEEYDWIRKLGATKHLHHPQQMPREDFADGGAPFLQATVDAFVLDYLAWLNSWAFSSILAAVVATADIEDEHAEIALAETAAVGVLASTDVDSLIASLSAKYRRGACFAGNAAMASRCRALRAGTNGACLWQSGREGELPTFCDRAFIEDEGVSDGCLIFGNPWPVTGIAELEAPQLYGLEEHGSDTCPDLSARAAVVVKDARACKALLIAES